MNKQKQPLKSRSSNVNSSSQSKTTKRKRVRKRGIPSVPRPLGIKKCSRDYLQALIDPFGYNADMLPCIPDFNSLPSYKLRTKLRSTVSIGTAGFGYVVVAPDASSISNIHCLYCSSSTYNGTTVAINSDPGVVPATNAQYPYDSSNFRPVRIVASGLRVRYTGTELNRGGVIALVRNNYAYGNSSNLDGADFTDLLGRDRTVTVQCDRNWHGVNLFPTGNQLEYWSFPRSFLSSSDYLCIAMTGTPGNTYEVEFINYFEILPTIISGVPRTVPSSTASHCDAEGFSAIRDWLNSASDAIMGSNAFHQALRALPDIIAGYAGWQSMRQPQVEWNL